MKHRALVLHRRVAARWRPAIRRTRRSTSPPSSPTSRVPRFACRKLWSASVGGGGKKLRLGLGLATAGNRLFAAGRDGDVAAFDLKTGKQTLARGNQARARRRHRRGRRAGGRRFGRRPGRGAGRGQRRAALARRRQRRNPVRAGRGRQPGHRAHRRRQVARARAWPMARRSGPRNSRSRASRCAAPRRRWWRVKWRFPASTTVACSR